MAFPDFNISEKSPQRVRIERSKNLRLVRDVVQYFGAAKTVLSFPDDNSYLDGADGSRSIQSGNWGCLELPELQDDASEQPQPSTQRKISTGDKGTVEQNANQRIPQ